MHLSRREKNDLQGGCLGRNYSVQLLISLWNRIWNLVIHFIIPAEPLLNFMNCMNLYMNTLVAPFMKYGRNMLLKYYTPPGG